MSTTPNILTMGDIEGALPTPVWTSHQPETGSLWFIFATKADRDAAHALFRERYDRRTWLALADRYLRLNYSTDWADAQGYGLHIANAPKIGDYS
jgi:hypothetical protein